jgi:hypothetical protein
MICNHRLHIPNYRHNQFSRLPLVLPEFLHLKVPVSVDHQQQILAKIKEVPAFVTAPHLLPLAQQLRRARTLLDFRVLLSN